MPQNYNSTVEGEKELEGYSELITDKNNFNVNTTQPERPISYSPNYIPYANNIVDINKKEVDYSQSANLPNDPYELKKWIIDLRNDLDK